MPISTPTQIAVPFATSGLKNAIPAVSDPVTGRAGYDQGFTAINMTPRTAGGIPPFGQDFNGIFFDISSALQFLEAGGGFPYNSAFATAVGGYPLGALVSRTDGSGLWRNTVANNTTNPETFGAGWQPEDAGITTVAMTNANVTLTALQAARSIIIITGPITANIQLIFPAYKKNWTIVNNGTGAFTVTAKTASGSGVTLDSGATQGVYGDGTNINSAVALIGPAPGQMEWFATMAPPANFLAANGSAVSRVTYAPLFNAITAQTTGSVTNGSNSITGVTSPAPASMWVGMPISGPGIPAGATVSAVGGSTITLSANATATSASAALVIAPHGVGDGTSTFNIPDGRGVDFRGWDNGRGLDPSRVFGSYQTDQFPAHTHAYGALVAVQSGSSSNVIQPGTTSGASTGTAGTGTEVRVKNLALLPCIKY